MHPLIIAITCAVQAITSTSYPPGPYPPLAQSHAISTPGTTTNAPTNAAHPTLASAPAELFAVLAAAAVPVAALGVSIVMGLALAVRVTTTTLPLPLELNAAGLNVKPVFDGKATVAAAEGEAVR